MYKRIVELLLAIIACSSVLSCKDASETEISVAASDANYIAAVTKLSEDEALALYQNLIACGMSEGIKYITKWTEDDKIFYRVRTSAEVLEIFPQEDGSFEIVPVLLAETDTAETEAQTQTSGGIAVVINVKTKKFHYPDCRSVASMKDENKLALSVADIGELYELGYSPCGICIYTEETSSAE